MLAVFAEMILVATLAAAGPTPTAAASPTGDDAVVARAQATLAGLQKGTVDRTQLAPDLDLLLTPEVLAVDAHELPSGSPTDLAIRSRTHIAGETTYVFRVRFANGAIDFTFGTSDATGKIDKLFTRPGPP